jgi:uncharacterized OsmC-like protein
MATTIAHIDQAHYKTTISNNRQQFIADEPIDEGGTDLGFSPNKLLCVATLPHAISQVPRHTKFPVSMC